MPLHTKSKLILWQAVYTSVTIEFKYVSIEFKYVNIRMYSQPQKCVDFSFYFLPKQLNSGITGKWLESTSNSIAYWKLYEIRPMPNLAQNLIIYIESEIRKP